MNIHVYKGDIHEYELIRRTIFRASLRRLSLSDLIWLEGRNS